MNIKSIKLFYLIVILLSIYFISCDDAGVKPLPVGTTAVTFNKVFKTLDITKDGTYELWLRIDSVFISYGKFNIDANGNPTDLYGNPKTLTFPETFRSRVNAITKAWLTIEPPEDVDTFPSASVLIAGNFIPYTDSIAVNLTLNHPDAFGTVGDKLLTGVRARYMCYNKTVPDSGCMKGLWFCDLNGNSFFEPGLDLSYHNGWTYEGWLFDKTTGEAYSMGKFSDPYNKDLDNAGNCAGPNPGFNAPGQEWQIPGCSNISNLQNSNYRIIVSVEPKFEIQGYSGADKPFFFYPYFENQIQPVGCGREVSLYNAFNFPDLGFPQMHVRIAKGDN